MTVFSKSSQFFSPLLHTTCSYIWGMSGSVLFILCAYVKCLEMSLSWIETLNEVEVEEELIGRREEVPDVFTWKPSVIASPNQTCFFAMLLPMYQFFLATSRWVGDTQVSPVSMLQYTLIASWVQPWSGSIQYSPREYRKKSLDSRVQFV